MFYFISESLLQSHVAAAGLPKLFVTQPSTGEFKQVDIDVSFKGFINLVFAYKRYMSAHSMSEGCLGPVKLYVQV